MNQGSIIPSISQYHFTWIGSILFISGSCQIFQLWYCRIWQQSGGNNARSGITIAAKIAISRWDQLIHISWQLILQSCLLIFQLTDFIGKIRYIPNGNGFFVQYILQTIADLFCILQIAGPVKRNEIANLLFYLGWNRGHIYHAVGCLLDAGKSCNLIFQFFYSMLILHIFPTVIDFCHRRASNHPDTIIIKIADHTGSDSFYRNFIADNNSLRIYRFINRILLHRLCFNRRIHVTINLISDIYH